MCIKINDLSHVILFYSSLKMFVFISDILIISNSYQCANLFKRKKMVHISSKSVIISVKSKSVIIFYLI